MNRHRISRIVVTVTSIALFAVPMLLWPRLAAADLIVPDPTDLGAIEGGTICPAVTYPSTDASKKSPAIAATRAPSSPAAPTPSPTAPTGSSIQTGLNATAPSTDTIFTFEAPPVVTSSALSDQTKIIDVVLGILFTIAGVLFVLLIPIGGLMWMLAVGNEESSTKARKLLINAVIGLTLTVAAGAIADLVFIQIGLPYRVQSLGATIQSMSTGTRSGSPTSAPAAGERDVTFLLQAVLASGTPAANLQLTLADAQNHQVGQVTTDAHGNGPGNVRIPTDETTLNLFLGTNDLTRVDAKVGQITIPGQLTGAGCIPVVINQNSALMNVAVTVQANPNNLSSTTAIVKITATDGETVAPSTGSIAADHTVTVSSWLHANKSYTVTVQVGGVDQAAYPLFIDTYSAQPIHVTIPK